MYKQLFLCLIATIAARASEWLQCGYRQYQAIVQNDSCQQCNASCNDCFQQSSNQFPCLTCSSGYFYNSLSNKCEQVCPMNTRQNQDLSFCEPCLILNCQSCDADSSICTACYQNFNLVGNDCLINSEPLSTGENTIDYLPKYLNQMECTDLIDDNTNSFADQIQWQLFDEENNNLFIVTTFDVYKYDLNSLQLLAHGSFPYNGFVRDCGFYPPDKVNFYCTSRPFYLIQYDRNLLNQTLVTTFSGVFPNYSNFGNGNYFPPSHYGRIYQKYYSGLIASSVSGGLEIYSFATNSKVKFLINGYTNQNYAHLNYVNGYLMYDQAKDNIYFKQNPGTEYLFVTGQTGYLYSYETLTPKYLLLLHKFGANVCDTALLTRSTPTILATDCVSQNTSVSLIKYSFPAIITNFESDQLLAIHENIYGCLLIYDYQNVPDVKLVVGRLNTTLSYQQVGYRQFIMLNYNHQLSLLTIAMDGTLTEITTPPLTQYIFFLMSYGTRILQDKIILTNAKQALSIKYNLKDSQVQDTPLKNFQSFLSSDQNNFAIQPIFGLEPILNYDYPTKVFYDSTLELHIYIQSFSIRLKYINGNILEKNEIMFELEQNSSYINDALYVYDIQQLILMTLTEQIILAIPSMEVIRRDRINILAEKLTIFYQDQKIITCAFDKSLYLQYIAVDLTLNTMLISEVFMSIQDYFVGYDKVVLLNNTYFNVITVSTQQNIKISPGFNFVGVPNIFFQEGSTCYLALYQQLTIPQIWVYNMDQIDFSVPELILTFPNIKFINPMFDYYQGVYSLYTVQSDGIYTYELDNTNQFVQKSSIKNTAIKTFKNQVKLAGIESFSKILISQPTQGVIVIDKVTKQFQLINMQLVISSVSLLINKIKQEEILAVSSLSQTIAYSFVNGIYRVITNVQANCFTLQYLDTSELLCRQTIRNDTSLIPINNFKVFELVSYPQITKTIWDENNQLMIVILQNKMIKVLNYDLYKESEVLSIEIQSGIIDYIFYDSSQKVLLYSVNSVSIYTFSKGSSASTLVFSMTPLLWNAVYSDKQLIIIYIQDFLYVINYITLTVNYNDNILQKVIASNTRIISNDRIGDYFYIYFDKVKIMKYSFTQGVQVQITSNAQEIYINSKRTDGSLFVLTSTEIMIYQANSQALLQRLTYTSITDLFTIYQVSIDYIFVQPSATVTSYIININTLQITTITFRAALYAVSTDMNNYKICSLTIDHILTIQDIFNHNTLPVFFILQEFADDLLSNPSSTMLGIQVRLQINADLDCVIITQASYIYVYSITYQSLLHAIRKNTNDPIYNYWNIGSNIILYYDQSGIYFYDLHSILQMQSRFYSPKFKLRQIMVYQDQTSDGSLSLIESIYTRQLKNFRIIDGYLLSQNQLRKSYLIPILVNTKLVQIIYSSNQKIIIRDNIIYVVDSLNQIIDSLLISGMSAVAPLTSYILPQNIIYIITIDNNVIKVDLTNKTNQISQQLQSISSVLELPNQSFIFHFNDATKQNFLVCFDTNTQGFIDMSASLSSLTLTAIIKDNMRISDTSFLFSTVDGYLYEAQLQGCSFQGTPQLLLSQQILFYFYDTFSEYTFIQRKGQSQLELLQNNILIQTPMKLPSYSSSNMKISDDLEYYILFSELYLSIYSTRDMKLRVSIYKIFMSSEIKDVLMLTPDFILVITNTNLFAFHIIEDQYFKTFSYTIEMPKVLSTVVRNDYLSTSFVVFIDISIISMQGFVQLNLPIYLDMKNSSRKCFYQQDLDSKNLTKAPLVSNKIQMLTLTNQKSNNIQNIDSIIFTVGQQESLSKLSTIPMKVTNLVLDSNTKPNQSQIIVDSFFVLINTVSSNVFLQNTVLQFQENISPAANPNLSISNKQIVFFQNINLDGFRQSFYFTLLGNDFVRFENFNILSLKLIQEQAQQITGNAFFNIDQTNIISIQNIHLKDITFVDNFTVFNIQNATKLIIKNLIIENIECKDLTIFQIQQIESIEISEVTLRNINCYQFQLIQSILATTMQFTDITFTSITSSSPQPTIIIQAIKNLSINNFLMSQCIGLNVLSVYKYDQNDTIYAVQNVQIDNFSIIQSSNNKPSQLRQLQASTSQSTNEIVSIIDSNNLQITNFSIDTFSVYTNKFLTFNSQKINFSNFILNLITADQIVLADISIQGDTIELQSFAQSSTFNLLFMVQNAILLELVDFKSNNNQLQTQQATTGLFSVQNIQRLNIKDSHFEGNSLYQPAKGAINLLNIGQFNLINTVFIKNQAFQSSGSCLYIVNTQLDNLVVDPSIINNCQFIQNQSLLEQGGALYVSEQNISILNSKFQQNQALIGGAIKINSISILPDFFKDSLDQKDNGNQFINNIAELYGADIGYFPQKIQLTQSNGIEYQDGQDVEISNFQSNTYIDDLKLRIIDNEGQSIHFPTETLTLQNLGIQQEFLKYQFNIDLTTDIEIFVSQSQIILQNYEFFQFNATILMAPNTIKQLVVKSAGTLPIIKMTEQGYSVVQEYLKFSIDINSIDCQIGDFFQKINQLTYCVPCPDGQYSLDIPDLQNKNSAISCKYCPSSAVKCQGSIIMLKNNYWRQDNLTDEIYSCDNKISSCLAESKSSINLCGEGYIGPLCATCDSLGTTWGQRYSQISGSKCSLCGSSEVQVFIILGFFTLTASYLVCIILQNIRCSKNKILLKYTENIVGISLGFGIDFSRNSVLVKILMNYIQIYLILDGSGFSLPTQTSSLTFVGDPSMNVVTSADCLLKVVNLKSLIFIRIILKICSFLLLYVISILAVLIQYKLDLSKSKKLSYSLTYLSMAFKTIFIYGGFGIVTDAVRALSCVQIGSKSYRLLDKRIECSSDLSQDADIYIFATLVVLVFAVVIPVSMLLKMRNIFLNKKTQNIEVIKSYNFLFQEYKIDAIFWDIVKIMLKYFIIFVINFFESDQYAKIQLALIFLVAYNILQINYQPYKNKIFNKTDLYSIFTCQITLINTACISSTSNAFIQNILIIFTITINCVFLIGMMLLFIRGIRLDFEQETKNPIKTIFKTYLLKMQPYLKFQVIKQKEQFKALRNWMSLKKKIIGCDGHIFIEYMTKTVQQNKLVQKQINNSSNIDGSNYYLQMQNSITNESSAKKWFNYPLSPFQKFNNEKQNFSKQKLKNQKSDQNFPSNFLLKGQIVESQFKLQLTTDGVYPTQEDEVKNLKFDDFTTAQNYQLINLKNYINKQEYDFTKDSDEKQKETEDCQVQEDTENSVKMYQSQSIHDRQILFSSSQNNSSQN